MCGQTSQISSHAEVGRRPSECLAGFTVAFGLVMDLYGHGGHPTALMFLPGAVRSGSLTLFSQGLSQGFRERELLDHEGFPTHHKGLPYPAHFIKGLKFSEPRVKRVNYLC